MLFRNTQTHPVLVRREAMEHQSSCGEVHTSPAQALEQRGWITATLLTERPLACGLSATACRRSPCETWSLHYSPCNLCHWGRRVDWRAYGTCFGPIDGPRAASFWHRCVYAPCVMLAKPVQRVAVIVPRDMVYRTSTLTRAPQPVTAAREAVAGCAVGDWQPPRCV